IVLAIPPCRGQGSECSCSSNSGCDESGVCRCDPGWGGPLCAVCLLKPGCLHGSCQQPWQCRCDPGWGGRFCDKDLQVCSQRPPCLNGASCVMEDSGDYSCVCPEGFHGRDCELKTGPCQQSRSPCRNGGLCEDDDGFSLVLRCSCLAGFSGPRCETDLDDCLMDPCANGASCLDGVNRFSCVCPPGFSGRFCTENQDDCARRPCLHEGRCLDRADGFLCLCRPGFSGDTCQTVIRDQRNHRNYSHSDQRNHRNQSHTDHRNQSPDDEVFRVTVSERSAPPSLSRVQLSVLMVLGGGSLAAVMLTAGLLLQGYCRGGGTAGGWTAGGGGDGRGNSRGNNRGGEAEVQISFLNVAEPEKKKLNTEVI
ncbi:LOW QUALITY PROTEIN: protein delta homolog 2-like, partial [Trematomus bernacchii]|uniref:LOW QUALITY PROTEIN: protein delta homolog 2-like n=1 Tax=Trematomus bernacchii TaxID=40690 RepID=UPI00146C301A